MNHTAYDLIVVGGGPAGAAATLYAHRRGLRVLLLDRARFPRDKICGDSISGKSLAILDELDLLPGVDRLPGAVAGQVLLASPDRTQARFDLGGYRYCDPLTGRQTPPGGYLIRRLVFDAFLFEAARRASAGCVEGFTVRDLVLEDGAVRGVRGHFGRGGPGAKTCEFRAPLVLGCDGAGSIVARRTGLYAHDGRHASVALRCYYEGVAGLGDRTEIHFADEVMPGYFWIFPLEDGRANVGVGMLHQAIRRRRVDLRQALTRVLSRPPFDTRFAAARALEEPVGWSLPLGSRRRPCSGAGFLLLGDAAGLVDPFSGEGIGNALYSARIAAGVAAEACQAGDFGAACLSRYDQRLWQALGPELKVSARLQWLGRWRPFLNLLLGRAARSPELARFLTNAYTNAVPRQELLDPLLYLKALLK
ncbi:MAG: geranylgeranyl reductase family protein [Gemmatimonadota bacterium]